MRQVRGLYSEIWISLNTAHPLNVLLSLATAALTAALPLYDLTASVTLAQRWPTDVE